MNDRTSVLRRPPGARTPAARAAAASLAIAALALLAAACGGSPSSAGSGGTPDAGGSASSPSAVGYSHCIRSHGVPDYPDPPSGGGIAKASAQELGVSSSQLQTARQACQHLIPATGGQAQQQEQRCFVNSDCSPTMVRRLLNVMLRFAQCMRAHGVPNFPDPSTNSQGQPLFNISAHGISDAASHSPQFIAKLNECQRRTGNFPFTFG